MRLWSLHPRYLDRKALVAAWREGLLAQAVLAGRTRGYRNHPQLARFRATPLPVCYVAAYLNGLLAEAVARGYRFDGGKIDGGGPVAPLTVARGQLDYEWAHLKAKLRQRDPDWLTRFAGIAAPEAHPLFRVVPGGVAEWEFGAGRTGRGGPGSKTVV